MAQKKALKISRDYHDYVFRQRKFVGDFDGMYRHAQDVPWGQDTRYREWHSQVGFLLLGSRAPFSSILEVGCGLGYVTASLKNFLTNRRAKIHAFDISEAAVQKARKKHKGIDFFVDDIGRPRFRPRRKYDLVVVREVFWYLTPRLATVIKNIKACLKKGGYLYIGLGFPELHKPFVGKSIIPTPQKLVDKFKHLELAGSLVLERSKKEKSGPILHYLGRRK